MSELTHASLNFAPNYKQSAQIIHLTAAPIKILVVENDKANQMVTSYWLEEFGYNFEIAENGEEAVKKFQTGQFSIILMDIEMGIMNGYEATKSIREIEKRNKLKSSIIIAFTANGLIGDREKCVNSGMDDYFSKPVNYPILNDWLSKYAQQKLQG